VAPTLALQERLELLETENDLLLAQQGELEEEIMRLGGLLQDKDMQVSDRGKTHACVVDAQQLASQRLGSRALMGAC
jgi:hypothetical protein